MRHMDRALMHKTGERIFSPVFLVVGCERLNLFEQGGGVAVSQMRGLIYEVRNRN